MYEDIAPREYLDRQKDNPEWQLLDVREDWERDIVKVEGCLHIPMAHIPERLSELDAATPIAVICHSGGRSARVAGFLVEQGFGTVANIAGGVDAWSTDIDSSLARY